MNVRGQLSVFHPDGSVDITAFEHGSDIKLQRLQSAVGGYIELIPYFHRIKKQGEFKPCIAYCNEEGKLKGLPLNPYAQSLWEASIGNDPRDYLVGSIAVVSGEPEFLKEHKEG